MPTVESGSFLGELIQRATQTQEGFEELLSTHSSERLRRRPAPDSWSAVECLEHLNQVGRAYRPRLKGAVESAAATPERASWNSTFFGRFLRRAVDPGSPRKVRTVRLFKPVARDLDPSQTRSDFVAEQEALLELLRRAAGRDLDRRLGSPLFPWLLRRTLADAFFMLVNHQVRHLDQARRALGNSL